MNPNTLLILTHYLGFTRLDALEKLGKDMVFGGDMYILPSIFDFISKLSEEEYTWVSLMSRETLKSVEPTSIEKNRFIGGNNEQK